MAQRDPHHQHVDTKETPPTRHFAVVPSDSDPLPILPLAIYVETAGVVVIEDPDGVALPYNLPANTLFYHRAYKIRATDTTATTIYGLY